MSKRLLDTPARHDGLSSLLGIADGGWQLLCEGAFKAAKGPASRLAEIAVTTVLQRIKEGYLRIITPSTAYTFPEGGQHSELQAEFNVKSDVFWIRLATMGDLGFAESYMYGEIECEDLISVFRIFLLNRAHIQPLDNSRFSALLSLPQRLLSRLRFVNSLGNARANVSAHYDISNAMFEGFLSRDMTYSCAIFKELDGDLKKKDRERKPRLALPLPTDMDIKPRSEDEVRMKYNLPTPSTSETGTPTNELEALTHGGTSSKPSSNADSDDTELHEAQMRKLDHIIRCARIGRNQRVLEIGSGWGSLALRIAERFPGTTVDTLTLSVHQQSLARARISKASANRGGDGGGEGGGEENDLENRVRVHLMDYRSMPPEWEGTFDRVVSVEMVEAVGLEYLEEYFRVLDWALNPRTGVGVVQSITIPEARFERYSKEIDFIQKWIFPGGILPTLTLLLTSLTSGSSGKLIVDSVSNIGPHYARTLREWRRRFERRFEDVIVPALREAYPDMVKGERGREEVEVFKRKWIYYYCYCEIGFTTRSLGDHIITFAREGDESFGCSVFE